MLNLDSSLIAVHHIYELAAKVLLIGGEDVESARAKLEFRDELSHHALAPCLRVLERVAGGDGGLGRS